MPANPLVSSAEISASAQPGPVAEPAVDPPAVISPPALWLKCGIGGSVWDEVATLSCFISGASDLVLQDARTKVTTAELSTHLCQGACYQ